jgi:hypothetical protein
VKEKDEENENEKWSGGKECQQRTSKRQYEERQKRPKFFLILWKTKKRR